MKTPVFYYAEAEINGSIVQPFQGYIADPANIKADIVSRLCATATVLVDSLELLEVVTAQTPDKLLKLKAQF